jgi:transforming growth factor-beta-induced protein
MFSKKLVLRALLGSVLALTLAACGMMPEGATERGSIAEIASANPELSTLVAALDAADFVPLFSNDAAGPFTVFAPTNAAFDALLADLGITAGDLLADTDLLTEVLTYHVTPGNLSLRDVTGLEIIPTLFGMPIAQSGGVLDGSSTIRASDIAASNGTIHVIDEVLLPTKTIADIAVADSRFSTLVTALSTADLVGAVADETADLTVFAPTNDAFGAALTALGLTAEELLASDDLSDILLYHVLPQSLTAEEVIAAAPTNVGTLLTDRQIGVQVVDGGVVLNGSVNVVITDLKAVNGVIHVIDFVLLPTPTIAEIAVEDGRFETLVAALGQAGLVDLFDDRNGGPFTVFAPTDAAFTQFLSDESLTPGDLLASADLGDILSYHVVNGALSSADVLAAITAGGGTALVETLLGEDISVTLDGTDVEINGVATVTGFDIQAANGVIHVIDYVLLPPSP